MGGGGGLAGEVQKKKNSRKGKLNEKKFLHANEPEKIFMLWP